MKKIELLIDRVMLEDGKEVPYKKGDVLEMDDKRADQYILTNAGKTATVKKTVSSK